MAEFSVNIEKMEEVAADAEQVSRILGKNCPNLKQPGARSMHVCRELVGKASGESMRLRIR